MTSSGDHSTPTRPPRPLSSLRGRYLFATLLLAGGVISFILLLHTYINTTRSERLASIEARHTTAYHTRLLREAVLSVEKELQTFLWSPNEAQRRQVHTAIDHAQQRQGELLALGWLERNAPSGTLHTLERELRNLHGELDHMMDTRMDKQLQFPAMPIITDDINPGNSEFLIAVRLAIEESAANGTAPNGSALHRLLNRLRNDWLLMVSQFRIYIANRIGALIDSEAAAQEHDIELLQNQIETHLQELARLERQGRLDLPLAELRRQMAEADTRWFSAYRAIKAIPPGAYWRLDAAFMQGTIAPLFQNVWQRLQQLDQAIETAATDDTRQLYHASENVVGILWGIALAVLAAILAGFILFERAVLNPLALIVRALRDEAHGKRDITLPIATTAETQQLVDAFTEMRRLVQERQHALEHQALHDALTGLPNRTLLQDRLQQGIHHLRRTGAGSLALLMMDLDGFKEVNDTLGHPIGDGILRQLSERLTQLLRETDTIARMGGDEFGILLEEADEAEARRTAARVLQLLERPFEVAGQSLYVSGSIGIALYPRHALNPEELSRRADVAMYVAKREKNGVTVYDTRQDHYTLQRLAQGSDLRNAINDEQLQLHFQPQIDLRTGTYAGVEALLRWEHPQRGFIPPDEFIPIAEQTGMIRHLTYWVLDQALARCAAWRHRGLPLGSLAVNLSAYNLQDPDLYLEVDRLLRKWGIPPYLLTLEITESSMMANPSRALATLERLNDIGVQLAIDDFGTGFSSLSYLKQLPVDKLKIDKSFVIQMEEDENDAMIVHSTIDLAHNLGLEVVAEGVETEGALALLRGLECDVAQGYLFSHPMSAMDLEDWLASSPYCLGLKQDDTTPLGQLPTTH